MATTTKIKKPIDCYMVPVKFGKDDRDEILNNLWLHEAKNNIKKEVIERLERYLTLEHNRLRRLPDRPSPAHVRQHLALIHDAATKLAGLLSPACLSVPVRLAINLEKPSVANCTDFENLHFALDGLAVDAQFAIQRIDSSGERSDGGARNAVKKEAEGATMRTAASRASPSASD
jgi:hypothetical protein